MKEEKEPWYLNKYLLFVLLIAHFPILDFYGEYVISREFPKFLQFIITVAVIAYIILVFSLYFKKVSFRSNTEEDDNESEK
jgi:uncharacterized membrane protein